MVPRDQAFRLGARSSTEFSSVGQSKPLGNAGFAKQHDDAIADLDRKAATPGASSDGVAGGSVPRRRPAHLSRRKEWKTPDPRFSTGMEAGKQKKVITRTKGIVLWS